MLILLICVIGKNIASHNTEKEIGRFIYVFIFQRAKVDRSCIKLTGKYNIIFKFIMSRKSFVTKEYK